MTRKPGRPVDADGDGTRVQILRVLTQKPGLTRAQLAQELGYHIGTIRFHLESLEEKRAIHCLKKGRAWTYYRRDVPRELHLPMAAMAHRRAGHMLRLIEDQPGLRESQIAQQSDWSRKVIRRLVAELEAAGLIRRRPGRGLVIAAQARNVEHYVRRQTRQGLEVLEQMVDGRRPPEGPD